MTTTRRDGRTIRRHPSAPTIARWIWLLAGLALLLGWVRDPLLSLVPKPRELPRLDGATGRPWISGDFTAGNPNQGLDRQLLPENVHHASSWLDTDEWTGRAETAWFRASRQIIHVAVAGYPQHAGCRLWAEFRNAEGRITRIDCPLANPRERWGAWEIGRPSDAVAVRILAEDRATDLFGWVAFSHPFRAWPGVVTAAHQHAQAWATVALVLTLLWGPGLLLACRSQAPETRTLVLLGAGPLLLATVGLLAWCLGGLVRPGVFGAAAVTGGWALIGVTGFRRHFAFELEGATPRLLGLAALLAVAVTAKSLYSVGPEGELYRGAISRNLTVGDRIDSRYPYYVVQVASHHVAPGSPEAERFFYPWTFFSRGPLSGLVALPVVAATGGQPPRTEFPEQRWSPFDRQGFAAYRITVIALSSGIVVAFGALLATFVGASWAIAGAGLLALAPFAVHEVMFTWPKWAATTWVVISFLLAHARRPFAGGLALGIGFLFHPMTLLWAPWIGLWAMRIRKPETGNRRSEQSPIRLSPVSGFRFPVSSLRPLGLFALGAALLALPWMAVGALMPHLPDTPFAGQRGFIRYFLEADWQAATWNTWWRTRWLNFANTFLPLHVYFAGFDHPRFQSAYEPSGRLVKFAFVWWNSLPFGLGLGLWALSLVALARAWSVLRAAVVLFVIGPALQLTAYWGMDPLGLMRECGHPLFLAVVAITCVVAARQGGWLSRVLQHRAVPWLQLPETWLMLWLTTLLNPRPWAVDHAHLDWLALAINAAALVAMAWMLARARTEILAPEAREAVAREPSPEPLSFRIPRLGWAIFGFAVFALIVGPLRLAHEDPRPLASVEGGDALAGNRGFIRDGVSATDRHEELPAGLRVVGSRTGRDQGQPRRHETGWFRAARQFSILVAGFPMHAGNRLELEVRRTNGAIERRPFDVHDIGEAWLRWAIELPADAEAARIIAQHSGADANAWFGFSEPFTSHPVIHAQFWSLVQLLSSACLAVTLIYGPGLLWFGRRPRELSALALAILPGPLFLAALGVGCWVWGGAFPPAALARVGVAALLAWIGWRMWRQRAGGEWPHGVTIVVAAGALLVGFAVAKANVSFGPEGELFGGRVSRTLAVGGHSDSQISYHVVQAVAHHLGPYAEQMKRYFAPWRFGSRGPISGLLAAPIVLATGAQVPFDHPTHPWRPFDREGFAVYRMACIALASLAGWVVFGVVAAVAAPPWGLVAATTAMLAPFFVHEIYFSWPKLIAGAVVLLAFLLIHQRRPFAAGVLLALGYLFHPLAALSAPFLGLWILGQPRAGPGWTRLGPALWFALGALVLVVPWQLIGRVRADGGANQDVFLSYFFLADSVPATASTWWQSRWANFAHTFVPGHLLTEDPRHDSLVSIYGPTSRWVQASLLWWNTLPFALGLPAFLLTTAAALRLARRSPAIAAVALAGPALLLVVYWGAAKTGLMRQCGHALFLSLIVVATWSFAAWPDGWGRKALAAFLHPACFAWRGFEIALMAFGTTLLHRRPELAGVHGWNDVVSLACAAACLAAVVILLANAARSLRSDLSAPCPTL